MGEEDRKTEGRPPENSSAERLDSWKEICAYLKRDIRTLRRWEHEEGLPVHRHLHNKLPTVYAYRPELDAWWNNRRPRLEAQEQVRRRSWRSWAMAAVVILAVAGMGLSWWARRPVLPFEERDWVLIASFENRTGDLPFDGTLEHALERELSNSRFVNVVPRFRVFDTLALMRQPEDTVLNAELAREVALRDGGIRVVLAGRVEKLGPQLVLSVRLINPVDGVTVASLSEEATEAEVGGAVRHIARRVRATLGERLPRLPASQQPLERVTTPSLRALRLFSQGSLLKEQDRVAEAEPLFREAIKEDPEFATAYMWLAWSVGRMGGPAEEQLRLARRALELSDKVSERERLFNQASYDIFNARYQQAYSTLRALLELYPDDYWTTLTMTWLPAEVGRPDETLAYNFKLADLRPNDLNANYEAALAGFIEQEQLERAQPYLERARKLAAVEINRDRPGDALEQAVRVEFLPMCSLWLRGEMEQAHQELLRLAQKLDGLSGRHRDEHARRLGGAYLEFGELRQAESACSQISTEAQRSQCLARVAFHRGDAQGFREHLRRATSILHWYTVSLASLGLQAEAQAEIAKLEKLNVVPGWNETARGLLALHRGRREALGQTVEAIKMLRPSNGSASLRATMALSQFFESYGDLSSAVRVLEEAEQYISNSRIERYHAGWELFEARARLVSLYGKVGRAEEAAGIKRELRKRLIFADRDNPIFRFVGQTELASAGP